MSKRKRTPMQQMIEELTTFSVDELQAKRIETGQRLNKLRQELIEMNRWIDSIRHVMLLKKNHGAIGISDHAVLRYMERYKGVDISSIRRELSELVQEKRASREGDVVPMDDGSGIIVSADHVATTVLTREMVAARDLTIRSQDGKPFVEPNAAREAMARPSKQVLVGGILQTWHGCPTP